MFYFIDGKTKIKVIAGKCLGTSAVIQTRIPILFLDIHVTKGASFIVDIPPKHNAFAYVWRGEGLLGEEKKEAKMGQVHMSLFWCPSQKLLLPVTRFRNLFFHVTHREMTIIKEGNSQSSKRF